MKHRAIVAFLIILTSPLLQAQSDAWQQKSNNNHVIELQKSGTPAEQRGQISIDFFGHAAFRITSPAGLSLLFDPWRNDPSGAWGLWFPQEFPEVKVDAVLSTHAHFDHDAVYRPEAPMVLDRMTGEWQLSDVAITGYADKHVCISPGTHKWHEAFDEFGVEGCPPNNPGHMDNVIFLIETGGMRIVIWGDNRANPAEHIIAELNAIDVLILPVDESQHLLSYEQSDAIVDRLNPKIVIPAHYLTSGASSVLSTLGTAEEWVDRHAKVVKLTTPSLSIDQTFLADKAKHIYYFGASHLAE